MQLIWPLSLRRSRSLPKAAINGLRCRCQRSLSARASEIERPKRNPTFGSKDWRGEKRSEFERRLQPYMSLLWVTANWLNFWTYTMSSDSGLSSTEGSRNSGRSLPQQGGHPVVARRTPKMIFSELLLMQAPQRANWCRDSRCYRETRHTVRCSTPVKAAQQLAMES